MLPDGDARKMSAVMTSRATTGLRYLLTLIALAIGESGMARAEDPLTTVRAFCVADGAGQRLSPIMWQRVIAPLVAWPLEPAWDRLALIRGYEINSPRRVAGRTEVEIKYSVVAAIRPGQVVRAVREETVILELEARPDGGWLLAGAPPPPHIFEQVADADALAELLEPGSRYESSTAFAWQLLREAGQDIPYTTSAAIPDSGRFDEVATGAAGDLVLYYAHGAPYQVGWMSSQDTVLSASLNAGRQAAPFAAYPGTIRYWRPRRDESADDTAIDGAGDAARAVAQGRTPSPAPLRRR